MKNKKNRRISVAIVLLSVFFSVVSIANAYRLFNYRLAGGISNIKWTIYNYNSTAFPSNYSFNYATAATNGVVSWDSVISNCTFVRYIDGTANGCNVYFVFGDYGDDNAYGGCWFFDANGNRVSGAGYGSPTSNYDYVIVRCNNYFLKNCAELNQLKAFFAHELGHVLGVAHSDGSGGSPASTLMYSLCVAEYATYRIHSPQTDDINAVNAVY